MCAPVPMRRFPRHFSSGSVIRNLSPSQTVELYLNNGSSVFGTLIR